jgi:hypothetical protein
MRYIQYEIYIACLWLSAAQQKMVLDNYEKFYMSFADKTKQQYSSFIYEMNIQGKNSLTSFHIRNEDYKVFI